MSKGLKQIENALDPWTMVEIALCRKYARTGVAKFTAEANG